jgi:hypothetical protein
MGLLDYKKFLLNENAGKQTYINASDRAGTQPLGSVAKSNPNHDSKILAIKKTLAEEAFAALDTIIKERVPGRTGASSSSLLVAIKRNYSGDVDKISEFVAKLKDEPLALTVSSFTDKVDLFTTLQTYYGVLSRDFYEEVGYKSKAFQPGDMGPFEMLMSVFTTMRKGDVKGDLVDSNGVGIEVKGDRGRLTAQVKTAPSTDALKTISTILESDFTKERGVSSTFLSDKVFPILQKKKLTSAQATEFVTALSQYPKNWSTQKSEAAKLVEKGLATGAELVNLFTAIQMFSYNDTTVFDYILTFSDGYSMCKAIKVKGATLSELMTAASSISIAGWADTGSEGAIGITLKKR